MDPEIRSVTARADDAELVTAFERAVGILVGAWRSGHFFPRLVEPDRDREPPLCTGCSLAEACLRGDSSSRSRLREWADRAVERYLQGPSDLPPAERNLTTTWLLPSKRQITEGAGEEGGG